MKKMWTKRLFSSAIALMMGLSLIPTAAFAVEDDGTTTPSEITAPSEWMDFNYEGGKITVTYTIPEDADYETIHFPALNSEGANDVNNISVMPGVSIGVDIRVVDNSGKYSYIDNSVQVGAKELDMTDDFDIVYRAYNPALYSLIGSTDRTEVRNSLKDNVLGQLLIDEGYPGGIDDLDDFYCDYYQVENVDQISDEDLIKMFSGRANGSFSGTDMYGDRETNEQVAYLGWKNLYRNLWTLDGHGLLTYTEGSDAASALNAKFAEGIGTDAGVSATIKIDGPMTNDAYMNHNMYVDLSFSMGQDTPSEPKTDYPALDKQVQDNNDPDLGWVDDSVSAAAGETINFKLTSNVPKDLTNYLEPEDPDEPEVIQPPEINALSELNSGDYFLTFHDVMDPDLAFDEDSVEVTIGDTTLSNDETTQYIVTTSGLDDGCTFEVTMNLGALYKAGVIDDTDIAGATPIVVTYSADLSDKVVSGEFPNEAWVSYEGGTSSHDIVDVLTYAVKIYKYDQSTQDKAPLAGAEFTLTGPDGFSDTATSNAEGYATFGGLDIGTYQLTETKAPDGYVASSETVEITIPDDAGADQIVEVKFANSPIPHTGGMGTTMFTVGGAAILAAAGVLFVVTRRKKEA